MNLNQILEQPNLLDQLTPEQKTSVYQQLKKRQDDLQQQKLKAESQLDLKRQEQQDILKELVELTNQKDIHSIRDYITTQEAEFNNQLKDLLQQYSKLQ